MSTADVHSPGVNSRLRPLTVGGDYAAALPTMIGSDANGQRYAGRLLIGDALSVDSAGSAREFPGPTRLRVYGENWLSYLTPFDLAFQYAVTLPPDVWTEKVPPGTLGEGTVGFTDDGGYPIGRIRLEEDSILTAPAPNQRNDFTFLCECLAHEFGHIMLKILFAEFDSTAIIAEICAAFDKPVGDWDAPPHDERVIEATCEVYKDVIQGLRDNERNYFDEPGRKFSNRTKVQLQFSGWEQWKATYYKLLDPPARDNWPWLWRTGLGDWGQNTGFGEVNDLGGVVAVSDVDGLDPDEGGTSSPPPSPYWTGPDPKEVIYRGYLATCDIGMLGSEWVDPLPRQTYIDVSDLSNAGTTSPDDPGAVAAEDAIRRRVTYHPGAVTMNIDWARPPADWSLDPPLDTYNQGLPDWDGWRYAGRHVKQIFGDSDGHAAPGACKVVWQQTFDIAPNMTADGDEMPGAPLSGWTTLKEESFKLPEWMDSPVVSKTFTPPTFDLAATAVRLRIMMGYHYWDGAAQHCFNAFTNPQGATVITEEPPSYTAPTEDVVYRGLLLPYQWIWWENQRFGAYWEYLSTGEPGDAPTATRGLSLNIIPLHAGTNVQRMRYFWSQYRPEPRATVGTIGGADNQPTTGLPYGSGVDYVTHMTGPPGPPPPAGREVPWPYRTGSVPVPGQTDGGEIKAGTGRNIRVVG